MVHSVAPSNLDEQMQEPEQLREPELLQEPKQLRVRWTAAEDGVEDDAAHSEAAVEAHRTGERIEQGHRTADSKLQGHMHVEAHTDRQ